MKSPTKKQTHRSGLTLLEVMIALAILGTSLAAIGELIRIGADAADRATELTTAQFLCDTKLAEIKSGITPALSVGPVPFEVFETEEPWEYMVLVDSTNVQEGLILVEVTVSQIRTDGRQPVMVTLTTWMIDRDLENEADALESDAAAEEAAADAAATGSDSGRTNG